MKSDAWELKPAARDMRAVEQYANGVDVYITHEQLMNRSEVEVDGPRGRIRVKIPENFTQRASVRVPNQGKLDKQDVVVRFVVRNPST